MIKIQNKILCCGCEACVQVCPQKFGLNIYVNRKSIFQEKIIVVI